MRSGYLKQGIALTASVVIGTLFVVAFVEGATTISTNISTDGTLGVTGLSTFTAGYVTAASSTVVGAFTTTGANKFESTIHASSTMQMTGDVTLYGGSGGLNLVTSNTATSSATIGCMQTYATSTATPVRMTFGAGLASATTTHDGLTAVGVVLWGYGTCS